MWSFCEKCDCWTETSSESWIFDDGPTGGFQPTDICAGANDCFAGETFPHLPNSTAFMDGVCLCNEFYWEITGSQYSLTTTPEVLSIFPYDNPHVCTHKMGSKQKKCFKKRSLRAMRIDSLVFPSLSGAKCGRLLPHKVLAT